MAIFFNEGLPRSGKSLDALKTYVVPALKEGREVFAYIAGLNHEKIAELVGITPDRCRELLHPLTKDQVPTVYEHIANDSLVVLDEAQNFWPKQRKPLDKPTTEFVSEHGHRGLDILLMGQNMNDVHTLWTNRVAQKTYFLKRDAAGKPDEFTQIIYKPVIKGNKTVFQEVRTIKAIPYDTAYFGAYQSHTEDTTNKETYIDERANVWNNPIIKKWLPLYGLVFVAALGYLWYWFHSGGVSEAPKKPQTAKASPAPVARPVAAPAPAPAAQSKPVQKSFTSTVTNNAKSPLFVEQAIVPDEPPDFIDNLSQQARVRLAGYIQMGNKISGVIEWRSDSFAITERLSFDDIKAMGWQVFVNQDASVAILQKYNKRYIATAWPLPDPQGKIPQAINDKIASASQQE